MFSNVIILDSMPIDSELLARCTGDIMRKKDSKVLEDRLQLIRQLVTGLVNCGIPVETSIRLTIGELSKAYDNEGTK